MYYAHNYAQRIEEIRPFFQHPVWNPVQKSLCVVRKSSLKRKRMNRRRDAPEYCGCICCQQRNSPLCRDSRGRVKCITCKNVEMNADCFSGSLPRNCGNCLSILRALPAPHNFRKTTAASSGTNNEGRNKKQKVHNIPPQPVSQPVSGGSSKYANTRHSGTITDYKPRESDDEESDYDPTLDEAANRDDDKGAKLLEDYDDVTNTSSSSQKRPKTMYSYLIKTTSSSNNSNNTTVVDNSIGTSSANNNSSAQSDALSICSSSDDDVQDDNHNNDFLQLSERARPRSIKSIHITNPISGSRTSSGKKKSDCSTITSSDGIKRWGAKLDFTAHKIIKKSIKNVDGTDGFASHTLWCDYCHHEVAIKKSSIKNHIKSKKHVNMKDARIVQQAQIITLTDSYIRRQKAASSLQQGQSGITVAADILAYRHQVLKAFLQAGLPLHHFQGLKPIKVLLQSAAESADLSYDSMLKLIPYVRDEERQLISEEIKGRPVAFIFDGTTDTDEVFCVVLRFVDKDKWIAHRCVALRLFSRSFNGDHLAKTLIDILTKDNSAKTQLPSYLIQDDNLHFAIMDGASVNQKAIKNIKVFVPYLKQVVCLSHCCNVFGTTFTNDDVFSRLKNFIQLWSRLVKNSHACRRIFRDKSKHAVQHLSYVRWFTFSDVCNQVYDNFEYVKALVTDESIKDREECRIKLHALINENDDATKLHGEELLLISLAVIRDVCDPIRKACYLLEGDGFLAPFAYDIYESMSSAIVNLDQQIFKLTDGDTNSDVSRNDLYQDYLPETYKVMSKLPANMKEKAKDYMKKVEEAIRNLMQKISYTNREKLADQLNVFEGGKFCNIAFIYTETMVSLQRKLDVCPCFALLPHLSTEHKDGMRREFEKYKQCVTTYIDKIPCDDFSMSNLNKLFMADNKLWIFWREHSIELPFWYKTAEHFALIATSSASVERVFSLYDGKFTDKQQSALQDYKEGAVMVHANYNFRNNI